VVLLFSAIFVLASSRFSPRLASIVGQLKPVKPSTSFRNSSRPLSTVSMAPARYHSPPQAPPTFTATPSSVIEDTKKIIERARNLEDSLVKNIKPADATFANVLLPMAHDENDMGLDVPTLGFYQSVSANKALRDASREADQLFSDYGIDSAMREDVFKLVDAVSKAGERLDSESERYLEKARKGYIKYGLGIPAGPKRDRFKEIKQRLSEISIKFSKTLNEENGGLWFTPEELAGVPQDLVSGFKKGEDDHAGKLWVTFKYPVCQRRCSSTL